VQGWLRQYRQGGLSELLKENKRPGRTPSIPSWAVEKLREELNSKKVIASVTGWDFILEALFVAGL